MITYFENYLYGVNLDTIDNVELAEYCLKIENYLVEEFPEASPGWYGSVPGALNNFYNLFNFGNKQLNNLYHEIVRNVSPVLDNSTVYMIKGWMNIYRNGQNVKWHKHWPPEKKVWHGFYCVQVGNSYTSYEIPQCKNVIDIVSKEGLLVFGKSDGDKHSSSVWNEISRPRITLAFDIVPIDCIDFNKFSINSFIPFKGNV